MIAKIEYAPASVLSSWPILIHLILTQFREVNITIFSSISLGKKLKFRKPFFSKRSPWVSHILVMLGAYEECRILGFTSYFRNPNLHFEQNPPCDSFAPYLFFEVFA